MGDDNRPADGSSLPDQQAPENIDNCADLIQPMNGKVTRVDFKNGPRIPEKGARLVSHANEKIDFVAARSKLSKKQHLSQNTSAHLIDSHGLDTCVTHASLEAHGLRPQTSEAEESLLTVTRERVNAAARPILEAFARSRGIFSDSLQIAIAGSAPLTHPDVIQTLGGALRSKALREVIQSGANPLIVPEQVHAGLSLMIDQSLSEQLPQAVTDLFPDWNKPLVPAGQRHRVWDAEDAAIWLNWFPPAANLLSPLDVWDDSTAAIWLNDRKTFLAQRRLNREMTIETSLDASNRWKPSREVLDNLDEIEGEELTYRVFVERFRRDVMPSYISERRTCVRDEIEWITLGYQSLRDARLAVHRRDQHRTSYFDFLFTDNSEWIYDLSQQIVASYAWPLGFSEFELRSQFSS